VRKTNPKSLPTVWYVTFWNAKIIGLENRLGVAREEGGEQERWVWLPKGGGNHQDLNWIDAQILVVKLYYSLARCYHWGKLGMRYTESILFLTTACKIMITHNYLRIYNCLWGRSYYKQDIRLHLRRAFMPSPFLVPNKMRNWDTCQNLAEWRQRFFC
jgi:hypothetical protein